MLPHGGETQNIEKHSDVSGSHNPGVHHGPGQLQNVHGRNAWGLEGRALSALSRFGENARTVSEPIWLQRVQHQRALMEPLPRVIKKPTLSTILSEKGVRGALFVVSEMLFISRPLIYVLFIRKYGIRSWIPWFLSLVMDFLGMGFLTQVTRLKSGENEQFHLTGSEKDEMRRRKLLWALYLMRDPFFSKYTRQRLERTEKILEPVPLIGVLTGKIVELVVGAQTRYTYMSGS